MKIFDKTGKMKFPEPGPQVSVKPEESILKSCACHNGHALLSDRAMFDSGPGILLLARSGDAEGYIALSPRVNDKSRISVDLPIVPGQRYELLCPECREALPAFAPCPCGGTIVIMKSSGPGEFIGVCNVAGCPNALLIPNEDLLRRSGLFL
jgi:hypothetical protein